MIAHKSYLLKDFEVSTKSHDNTKLIVLLMRDSAAFIVTACAHKSRFDWLKVYRQKPFDLPLNPFSFEDYFKHIKHILSVFVVLYGSITTTIS